MSIHPIDVILHKRYALAPTDAEIRAFILAIVKRTPRRQLVTDCQIAAFLMAIFLRGLESRELATLTEAMRFSGEVAYTEALNTFAIDKHSTGGVGDKTSLLIAPILAAAGLAHPTSEGVPGIVVPMISGRSLGHTGGTLDKLETIPGFNTQLSFSEMRDVLKQCAAALIGLSNILSGWMLHLAGRAATPEEGAQLSDEILRSGAAYKAWLNIIEAQNGDTTCFEDPRSHHKPTATRTLTAPTGGYLTAMD